MTSFYYEPGEFGLEYFGDVEDEPDYDFNMLVVWKEMKTGKFLYGEDSG